MAVRVRILPQWLIDLHTGEGHSDKKTNGLKNHRGKTPVKNGKVHQKPEISSYVKTEEENSPSRVEDTNSPDRSEKIRKQNVIKVSPGKRVSRARLEMSSSDDEADVKPTQLTCSKDGENKESTVSIKIETSNSVGCAETKDTSDDKAKRESDIHAVNTEDPEASANDGNPSLDTANDAEDDQLSNRTSSTANSSTQITRPKCKYGKSCYRKNSQHRQDFSHPGDDDYATVDNRPECAYGLSCYRKNALHRQHYQHTKKVQKPRKAKRPKKQDDDNSSDDDDEYDLDDPFLNDASSDDYQPSGNESETDFSAEEDASASGDDKNPVNNDSKRTRRKRKH